MPFDNVYADAKRAKSYARLEFPGTYYLAYRDLPAIIAEHVSGCDAVDFGCGTGRSTRFLKKLGFDAIGVDIAADMLKLARTQDPDGDYREVDDAGITGLEAGSCDLVLSVFTFDNIPTAEKKITLFRNLASLLRENGKFVSVVSAPEIYTHEWASFTTRDFPENRNATSGDTVRIIMTDVEDRRPVEDVVFTDESYCEVYDQAGLQLVETYHPLALDSEPYEWVNETRIPPWTVYVLSR